ncbi:hypothetical protein [Microvirga solisilvae]|uniref:hypothetical protein n=1 Tax=Microvirga solisilvae TaxID=2919498 RepID=UPI0024340E5F|nr:hypothetical protein [Microvirga solisilvae]
MPFLNKSIGGAQKINAVTVGAHDTPRMTALADGGWLVTWVADRYDGLGSEIYQQRYDSSGRALYEGDKFVNTTTAGQQYDPHTTSLPDGGWIVTWSSFGQDGSGWGIYQQRFDAQGIAQGGEVRVNQTSVKNQDQADVVALADGGWLVTWQSMVSVGVDRWAADIYQQRYSKTGQPLYATEQRVNTTTADQQDEPSITALADGGWVVTWRSYSPDSSAYDLYQQRYDALGNARGGETRINLTIEGAQVGQEVVALADGGWVVTWGSYGQSDGIYQQRYDQTGRALYAVDKRVDTLPDGALLDAQVTALADGGWMVTWRNAERGQEGLYQQRYDKNGNALLAVEQRIVASADTITESTVSVLKDGSFIVAWNESFADFDTGVSRDNLYQQRFILEGTVKNLMLSGSAIKELAAIGTSVGTLSVDGKEPGESFTYRLVDTAGGRFKLVTENGTTKIAVANGLLLDYEQARSHTIRVQVEKEGFSVIKSFTLNVGNVASESVRGSSRNEKFVGGVGSDIFQAGGGNDILIGGGGNDKLMGGTGNDVLTGSAGRDVFVFNTKPNRKSDLDRITDFNVRDDTIQLENAVFRKLGSKTGTLKKAFFTFGTAAKDSDDHILYDTKTGYLRYDADGTGKGASEIIAKLQPKLAGMSYLDFQVI